MNILIPSTPRRLAITPTMVDDFLIDPVLGAKVIMGLNLDVFQKARLRTYWWVPNVIDSSGFGTGKSFVFWIFFNLRALLMPGQQLVAYYQTFGAGKRIFWPYYDTVHTPLFDAQKGSVDFEGKTEGKDNTAEPECWHQYFKNGAQVMMPAPNWVQKASGQAGLTIHRAGLDEWTKSEATGKKEKAEDGSGINKQILGRLRAPTFNQFHPLWGNGIVFMATAEGPNHPGWHRYKVFLHEVERGNPLYALFTSSNKDFSNLPSEKEGPHDRRPFKEVVPNWETIDRMKREFTRTHALREIYGLWKRDSAGWYSEEALNKCVQYGVNLGTKPECERGKDA